MAPEGVLCLSYAGHGTGLVTVLALYYASIGVPWKKQTWDGASDAELQHVQRQVILKWIGLPSAFISVGCQIAVTALGS